MKGPEPNLIGMLTMTLSHQGAPKSEQEAKCLLSHRHFSHCSSKLRLLSWSRKHNSQPQADRCGCSSKLGVLLSACEIKALLFRVYYYIHAPGFCKTPTLLPKRLIRCWSYIAAASTASRQDGWSVSQRARRLDLKKDVPFGSQGISECLAALAATNGCPPLMKPNKQ